MRRRSLSFLVGHYHLGFDRRTLGDEPLNRFRITLKERRNVSLKVFEQKRVAYDAILQGFIQSTGIFAVR